MQNEKEIVQNEEKNKKKIFMHPIQQDTINDSWPSVIENTYNCLGSTEN